MTPPDSMYVSFDPRRSRLLGQRWMARVGYVGDFGTGRTRAAAIRDALRIHDLSLRTSEAFSEHIPIDAARREVAR